MPTVIAIAVIESAGTFLVGQRPPNVPLAGLWEFPGGKVLLGETPQAAAMRECREETGLEVQVLGAFPTMLQQYEHGEVELHFFLCQPLSPETDPTPPFHWVSRGALANLEFPAGNRELLRILLNGG